MKNFLKQTFQPKTDKTTIKNSQNNSKEKIISKNKTKDIIIYINIKYLKKILFSQIKDEYQIKNF